MKTLKELVMNLKWDDIAIRFVLFYPHQEQNLDGYKYAFEILQSLEADEDSEFEIAIEHVDMGGESFFEVYGVQAEALIPGAKLETTALEYQDWEEWLAMGFTPETTAAIPDIDKVVHVLFEMTSAGWDPSGVAVERKELLKRYEQARQQVGKKLSTKELLAKLQSDLESIEEEDLD